MLLILCYISEQYWSRICVDSWNVEHFPQKIRRSWSIIIYSPNAVVNSAYMVRNNHKVYVCAGRGGGEGTTSGYKGEAQIIGMALH